MVHRRQARGLAQRFTYLTAVFIAIVLLFSPVKEATLTDGELEMGLRNDNIIVNKEMRTISWSPGPDSRAYCLEQKERFKVVPGRSFGNLPFKDHNAYLKAKCHRYFCLPHVMAGKGVFECQPI